MYHPTPDFNNLLAVLRNERPARPTLFEFYLNGPLYERFAGPLPANCPAELQGLLTTILAYRNLGYDYAPVVMTDFAFDYQNGLKADSVGTIIEQTSGRGGYALGTGNSIPEYTPVENYLAMIKAVRETHRGAA